MKAFLFTVYDSASGRYLEPFFAPTVEFAMREFKTAVNTDGHQFAKYPADYTLFTLGTFDGATGLLDTREPTSLGVALTFVENPPMSLEA